MSVSTNDLKRGMTLDLDGTLFQVLEFQHHKPGKGGAVVRTKLRNVKTGAVLEKTFNADEKVGMARVERSEMQYLYREGGDLVFMDSTTYEQHHVPAEAVGDPVNYLVEGMTAVVAMHGSQVLGVEIPASVVLKVTQSDPGVKGNTASGATKPAVLETGLTVQVPLFVEQGDSIKVDTRTGDYLTREK
jgi:elongation factor P